MDRMRWRMELSKRFIEENNATLDCSEFTGETPMPHQKTRTA